MNKNRRKQSSPAGGSRRPAPGSGRESNAKPGAAVAEAPLSSSVGGVRRLVAAGLFGAALCVALYLAWQSAEGKTMPGCGPESGCGQILTSRWSVAGTVPVSLLGAVAYAFLFFSSLKAGPLPSWRRRGECAASVLGLGGALWFMVVQAVIVKAFCPWCCTAHLLAGTGAVVLWLARRKERGSAHGGGPGLLEVALPLAAVAGLAILQSRTPEPERIVERTLKESMTAGPGKVSLYGGRLVLDAASLPVIGLPGAAVTAVALTDFTCPHCRELHQTLTQLAGQRAGQFSAVLLPAAFDAEAQELHRVMLSLWRIDPDGYRKTAEDLAGGGISPKVNDVLAAVQKQTGGKFYELAWPHAAWVQDAMRQGEELLALNRKEAGAATLPQLMIRDRLLSGSPRADTLAAMLDGTPSAPAATIASTPPPAPPVVPTKATITFESLTADFGMVIRGETAVKPVTFTNTGSDPLVVSDVKTSCGCTTVQGAQQTVAPGGTGSFELKLDTARFIGDIAKTADVESNASNGVVRLTVKAKVWSPVTLNPPGVTFGSVIRGTKVEPRVVDITVTEPEPLKLGGITCSNPYFHTEMKTVEEGRKYQLTVSVADLGDQPQNADLVLELGHPKMKEMRFTTFLIPVDPVVVQPAEFMRPAATLATSPTSSITIFCHDPALASFDVTDLAFSGGDGVKVTYDRQPNSKWGRINLTFPPGFDPEKAKDTQVTWRTNHPRYTQMSVPVKLILPPTTPAPPAPVPVAPKTPVPAVALPVATPPPAPSPIQPPARRIPPAK